jgi:hypothetical protein
MHIEKSKAIPETGRGGLYVALPARYEHYLHI